MTEEEPSAVLELLLCALWREVGPPQLRREPGSHQKADVPVHGIKGLIIDPGERRFGEARRDVVIFRNDGLYGPMLGKRLADGV